MKDKDELLKIFPSAIKKILLKVKADFDEIQEIRLRVDKPLMLQKNSREYFVSEWGMLLRTERDGYRVSKKELAETMEYIAGYSLYAFEEELKQGFITIQGGHRVGVAGKIVTEGGSIKSIKYISFLNIRLAHQIRGCADLILSYVICNHEVCHTLIISPPRCGKTTLLRDLIRQISNGSRYCTGKTVGVVDERSEIGGAYQGIPQNDIGIRTDLLDCCPKALGMMMLIRSMSPDVIAVDEIGDYDDIQAIESVLNCGCKLIATVHGSTIEDLKQKPLMQKLMQERIFERYILLNNKEGAGGISEVYDQRGTELYRRRYQTC